MDWLDIINDDQAGDNFDANHIELPAPITVELKTNIFREIRYTVDEENKDAFIRTERTFEVVNTKKKISNAAIRRKQQWVKFGKPKDTPKGQDERGTTNRRDGNFPFLWNGKNMQKKVVKVVKKKPKPKPRTEEFPVLGAAGPAKKPGVYRPWALREGNMMQGGGGYDDDQKPEIKISNLPQWSDFMNVKQLVDEFYRKHLHRQYIPKYRIRMIPSKRTLEQWHADPQYYARRLAEYERLSIVEFDEEKDAQLAIKVLDGHHYDSHILMVEKAKPRPPR